MIIGIDATNMSAGGGLIHIQQIIRNAEPKKYGFEKVLIWAPKVTLDQIDDKPWLTKLHESVFERNYMIRSLWQSIKLGNLARHYKCDLLFIPGGSFTTGFRPIVTLSHNLLPFDLYEIFRYKYSFRLLRFFLLRISQSFSFKKANGVIFLTRFSKILVEDTVGSLTEKTAIIPHGIDKRFILTPRKQNKISYYSFEKPFELLYVSTIEPYKHHHKVIDAVSQLRKENFPVVLKIIGPAIPPERKKLFKKIKSIPKGEHFIKYNGFVPYDKLPKIYCSANIFIFASSCENMPNILLEGMASGLPIACSNRGPMPEILIKSGVYFNPEIEKSIYDAVRKLILSPKLREKKADQAFNLSRKYAWKTCANDTFKFFEKVINNKIEAQ